MSPGVSPRVLLRTTMIRVLLSHYLPSSRFSICEYSENSMVIHFRTGKKHQDALFLSVPRDRPLDRIFCETSVLFSDTGALASYGGPPFICDLRHLLREIYRFYFRYVCLSQLPMGLFSFRLRSRLQKQQRSLAQQSFFCLSTMDLYYVRCHYDIACLA